ncbi:DNA-3-methyladenine glycosylase family protein [Telluria beijingensis]|uniref:DNA-3-methyladenine glycosylase family protein n=1 Tax=Telluria beijingensis TaxID=3068633 RepID=UPI002795AA7A|nr:DNA-3-methyladenine glycosylase 2 [Massilia sp. REN29]
METTLPLPPGYRIADLVAFHGRDPEAVAERAGPDGLRKGVLLDGVPTLLDIRFDGQLARCRIDHDGPAMPALQALAQEALLNVLGLRIDPAPFAAFAQDDPVLGPVLARQPGLRIVQSATVFEALTWAIIGQQINLRFAIALRRTLIQLAGRPHSCGLLCYPEAPDVARLALEDLTSRKFSAAKAETVLRVARMAVDGSLRLDRTRDAAQVSQELLAIKGIGPWTVNYVLLRGYGYPDCSLEGDVAVRAALHNLTGSTARPTLLEAQRLLARYAPHRTMAAAYLWASLGDKSTPVE